MSTGDMLDFLRKNPQEVSLFGWSENAVSIDVYLDFSSDAHGLGLRRWSYAHVGRG